MGFIVVLIEIWMLIRQTYSKIIPKYQAGGDLRTLFIQYTSKYWLFLLIGFGLMLFCLLYQREARLSKGRFFDLLLTGTACMLYTSVLGTGSPPSRTIHAKMGAFSEVPIFAPQAVDTLSTA